MSGTDGKGGSRQAASPESSSPRALARRAMNERVLVERVQKLAQDRAGAQGGDPYALLADAIRQIMRRD